MSSKMVPLSEIGLAYRGNKGISKASSGEERRVAYLHSLWLGVHTII